MYLFEKKERNVGGGRDFNTSKTRSKKRGENNNSCLLLRNKNIRHDGVLSKGGGKVHAEERKPETGVDTNSSVSKSRTFT